MAGPRRSGSRPRPPVLLREVRLRDRAAMYRLDHLCFEPGIAFTRAQLDAFFGLESLQGIAAQSRGRLIGFAIGYLRNPALGGVLTLDVHPDFRRFGVGRALFAELLRRLERAGAAAVRLEVDVRNTAARAFYRSFGFRRIARIPDYYGEGRDAFEMERAAPATEEIRGSAS